MEAGEASSARMEAPEEHGERSWGRREELICKEKTRHMNTVQRRRRRPPKALGIMSLRDI